MKLWNAQTKKWLIILGMAVSGWHAISMYYPALYKIPYTDNLMVLGAAGAVTLYGVYVFLTEY